MSRSVCLCSSHSFLERTCDAMLWPAPPTGSRQCADCSHPGSDLSRSVAAAAESLAAAVPAVQPLTKRVGLDQKWNVFCPAGRHQYPAAGRNHLSRRRDARVAVARLSEFVSWGAVPWPSAQRMGRRRLGGRRPADLGGLGAVFGAAPARPDFPQADHGATVRIIADDAPIPFPKWGPGRPGGSRRNSTRAER